MYPTMRNRPLATRYIQDNDNIPLEPEHLSGIFEKERDTPQRYLVSNLSKSGIGSFGREAQAAYLLDQVLIAIERRADVEEEMKPIGLAIQRLFGTVMEQTEGRWDVCCGSIQMILTCVPLNPFHLASFSEAKRRHHTIYVT